ncbi:MAG: MOSC N-terminal beta barrel domain-containing protein [Bacteroidota bacterium]
MLTVSELYIYPVKSLAGIAVRSAVVTSRGLQYDRRLMLVDQDNVFLTQREHPAMALLQPILKDDGIYIHHKKNTIPSLFIPHQPTIDETILVTIWDDSCEGQLYDAAINEWFSLALGMPCKLVYMPETSNREVDKRYARNQEITSFADGYPMLIIGQSSLDDLNTRLSESIPMNRFRPNIVFTGGTAFLEDQMRSFTINGIDFSGVKPCARCIMPTIDQDTLSQSKEPLKTLTTYRLKDNKILFGQNLLHQGNGTINIGNTIEVKIYKQAAI